MKKSGILHRKIILMFYKTAFIELLHKKTFTLARVQFGNKYETNRRIEENHIDVKRCLQLSKKIFLKEIC